MFYSASGSERNVTSSWRWVTQEAFSWLLSVRGQGRLRANTAWKDRVRGDHWSKNVDLSMKSPVPSDPNGLSLGRGKVELSLSLGVHFALPKKSDQLLSGVECLMCFSLSHFDWIWICFSLKGLHLASVTPNRVPWAWKNKICLFLIMTTDNRA